MLGSVSEAEDAVQERDACVPDDEVGSARMRRAWAPANPGSNEKAAYPGRTHPRAKHLRSHALLRHAGGITVNHGVRRGTPRGNVVTAEKAQAYG
jgi:hypothetical protein